MISFDRLRVLIIGGRSYGLHKRHWCGEHFITRARLDPRVCGEELVADFYNTDWNTVYEVADSEEHQSIERKARLWRGLGFHLEALRIGEAALTKKR